MKRLNLLLLLCLFNSCAYLKSVSQTSIPKYKNKIVTAKVEKNIIFLFNFSNDYLTGLTQQLINQCPNGSVKGILTKDESITYFPIIFHKNIVTATGYCVPKNTKKRKG